MNLAMRYRSCNWGHKASVARTLAMAILFALLSMAASSARAQSEAVLYDFCSQPSCSDGIQPEARLTPDGAGNFYGTTLDGGAFDAGTVFELSPNGRGGWNETVLYSFCSAGPNCADGGYPGYSPVILDNAGNLYGTGYNGGDHGFGVVFELSPSGGNWTETVLYSFANGTDGALPYSGVIMDKSGNLYGTTAEGGANQAGIVFELSPNGGGWTEQVIYNEPIPGFAGLTMDGAGNLFGATFDSVYELSPNGNGGWNPNVIHFFAGVPKDGSDAYGTPVLDQAGNLYGTTVDGGAANLGTVYKLTPGKKGKWAEKVLYSFKNNGKDGLQPYAGIVLDAAGNIYGTTTAGGTSDDGTVFELVAPGGSGGYKEKVLWSFNVNDGYFPTGSLILDGGGHLFGTSYYGGVGTTAGLVFEINPSAAATTTVLTSSPNPSAYGEAVTFNVVVAPAPPDGEIVNFTRGSTLLGTGQLSGGSANFTTSALPAGASKITAVYGGDLNFVGSTSNIVKQVVKK